MAYKAEIQIGVVGLKQLEQLENRLTGINSLVNRLNRTSKKPIVNTTNVNKVTANVSTLNKQLERTLQLQTQINKQSSAFRSPAGGGGGRPSGGGRRGPASPIGGGPNFPGSPGARAARNKRLESLMLGAGFPLLFGGGIGEVAGGVAGSFLGDGFGGQILLSAVGGIVDDFISKAGELGAALNPATANIEVLVDALGGSTTAAGAYITKLEDLGQSQEALSVATAELENLVGVQGVSALKEFGEDSTKLQTVFIQAMTQMQASVASLINSTGILKALTAGIESNVLLRQALESQDPRQVQLRQQRQAASGPAFFGANPKKYFAAEEQLIENQRLINAERQKEYETKTKLLTAEEKSVNIQKDLKKLVSELNTEYKKILSNAEKRIKVEQDAVDRGLSVAKARYDAEKAFLDLDKQRLERKYEYAETEKKRYNIALALYKNEVAAAEIEYKQQLESIAAEERKLEIKIKGLKLAEQEAILLAKRAVIAAQEEKDPAVRAQRLDAIKKSADDYLSTSRQTIAEVEKQLEAQRQIGEYQRQAAEAQLQGKIEAAGMKLEQKLVSKEIGLSEKVARLLVTKLQNASTETATVRRNTQQIVGVIETAKDRTVILANSMSDVAAEAHNAAVNIGRAISAQSQLNAMSSGGSGQTPQKFAVGGYVTGATNAVVGEGGPEYVIPAGKMDEAMSRYAAGQRGSSVIPSSISPQVNVTTGPVMNMNGSNYVSQQDFMAGLQTATRRGAELALSTLQKSNNARRAVGI